MSHEPETILIVDDEAAARKLLVKRLTEEGYKCHEAGNAEQALQQLQKYDFGLVILDNRMPGKSGIELLPEVRAAYPEMAIIMATATEDVRIAIECMKRGAYDCITKPFLLDEIVLGVYRAFEKRRMVQENNEYHHHLEDKVTEQTRKIRAISLNAVTALVNALEAKDKYTSGHSLRVANIAVVLAREAGLSQEKIDRIQLAGLVHDVGKIGVRESVLNKPSFLNEEELQHVRRHTMVGERILIPIAGDNELLKLVRNHHEQYNGSGYPDGLTGTKIPFEARILAVSDAYEAMTSERPYRPALSEDKARAELERCKGSQFDPSIVEIFLNSKYT